MEQDQEPGMEQNEIENDQSYPESYLGVTWESSARMLNYQTP